MDDSLPFFKIKRADFNCIHLHEVECFPTGVFASTGVRLSANQILVDTLTCFVLAQSLLMIGICCQASVCSLVMCAQLGLHYIDICLSSIRSACLACCWWVVYAMVTCKCWNCLDGVTPHAMVHSDV